MKQLLAMKCSRDRDSQAEINERIEQVVAESTSKLFDTWFICDLSTHSYLFLHFSTTGVRIAENATDYVNRVLDRMKSGVPGGGLDDF